MSPRQLYFLLLQGRLLDMRERIKQTPWPRGWTKADRQRLIDLAHQFHSSGLFDKNGDYQP